MRRGVGGKGSGKAVQRDAEEREEVNGRGNEMEQELN